MESRFLLSKKKEGVIGSMKIGKKEEVAIYEICFDVVIKKLVYFFKVGYE